VTTQSPAGRRHGVPATATATATAPETEGRFRRWLRARPLAGVVVAAGLVGAAATIASQALPGHAWWDGLPVRVGGGSLLAGGMVAWVRSPSPRIGALILLGGASMFLGDLRLAPVQAVFAAGFFLTYLHAGFLGHVILSYPTGILGTAADRVVVAVSYAACVGTQVVRYAADHPRPPWTWAGAQPNTTAAIAGSLLFCLLTAVIAVRLAVRWRRASPAARRPMTVLWGLAIGGGTIAVAAGMASVVHAPQPVQVALTGAFTLAAALIPLILVATMLRMRAARARVAQLVVTLQAEPEPERLRDALAGALGDPTLDLAFVSPDGAGWVDIGGRPVVVGLAGRHETLVRRRGQVLAIIICDPALTAQRPLLDAVVAAAGLALDNARLYARLQAQLAEVRASRLRISQAAYDERLRIRRDLHDGAQGQMLGVLVLLDSIRYALAHGPGGKPDTATALRLAERAHAGLTDAVRELRDLAQGVYPPVLLEQGLAAAVELLVGRTAVPVSYTIPDARWTRDVEVNAYFAVAEALVNIQKHAGAASATITVVQDAEAVRVTIDDDGVGGADAARGSGLRNLRDRVAAVGGRLDVDSPPGAGTCLRLEIPLE
jgi:signal transduction histidine kinase